MSRFKSFILLLVVVLTLTGCDFFGNGANTTTTTTTTSTQSREKTTITETEKTTTTTDYADDTIIEVASITSALFLFDATFSDIVVDTLFGRVIFTLTIHDGTYKNFSYFLVMRDMTSTKKTISLLMLTSSDFSRKFVYDFADNHRYQVYVGKDYKYSNGNFETSAAFMFQSPSFEERKHVEIASLTFSNSDVSFNSVKPDTEYTNIGLTISVGDPDQAISAMKLLVFVNGTNHLSYEINLDLASATLDEKGKLVIEVTVPGLSPGASYDFFVIASGNDGFVDFSDKTIGNTTWKMTKVVYMVEGYDGLYAFPYDLTYDDVGLTFMLHYVDEGNVLINGEPIVFQLNIRDENGDVVLSLPIETGDHSFTIPYEYLDNRYKLLIENEYESLILARHFINVITPTLNIYTTGYNAEKTFTITFDPFYNEITAFSIVIMFGDTLVANVTYDQLVDGTYTFTFTNEGTEVRRFDISVSYTYVYFKTHEVEYEHTYYIDYRPN